MELMMYHHSSDTKNFDKQPVFIKKLNIIHFCYFLLEKLYQFLHKKLAIKNISHLISLLPKVFRELRIYLLISKSIYFLHHPSLCLSVPCHLVVGALRVAYGTLAGTVVPLMENEAALIANVASLRLLIISVRRIHCCSTHPTWQIDFCSIDSADLRQQFHEISTKRPNCEGNRQDSDASIMNLILVI